MKAKQIRKFTILTLFIVAASLFAVNQLVLADSGNHSEQPILAGDNPDDIFPVAEEPDIDYSGANVTVEYIIIEDGKQNLIRIWLKYDKEGNPAINTIKRISKPGRREYVDSDSLPRVKNNLGVAVLTTSKGIMTAREALRKHIGGEVLCYIW